MWFIQYKKITDGREEYQWTRTSQTPSEWIEAAQLEESRLEQKYYDHYLDSYPTVVFVIIFAVKES